MNKRWLLNSTLLGVVVLLAVIAVWRPGLDKPEAKPALTKLKATDIQRISIKRPAKPGIVLARNNSDWKMVRPKSGRTNPFVVNDVLRILAAKNQQSLPPEATKQLRRYGLDQPKARLQLDKLEILFGDTNPVNNLQYVLLQDRVAMIDTSYFWAAARTTADFLSKRLLEKQRNPVALSLPDFRLSLKNGSWQIYPEQKNLSADRIKQMVDNWRYAQALSVKKYQGGRITDWVRLSFDGEKNRLRIGILAYEPEFILYRPDEKLQYHFPQDIGKRLLSLAK